MKLGEITDAQLIFANVYGQQVLNYALKQGRNKLEINMNEFAAGLYLTQVVSKENVLHKEKVIIH